MNDHTILVVPDLTPETTARLRARVMAAAAHDRARTRRRRAVALSSVAAAIAGALGVGLMAPTSSFASWTEVPTPLDVQSGDPVLKTCLTMLRELSSHPLVGSGTEPILGERRGAFTAVLFTAPRSGGAEEMSYCIAGDITRSVGSTPASPLAAGELLSLVGNGGALDSEGARFVYGRADPSVRKVTVATEEQAQVTASVRDGVWFAWWPAPDAPLSVSALDGTGGVVARIHPGDD